MDVLVYSLFQLHPVDFRVGYRVCPLSFVIPTARHVPYPDSEKPSFTYLLSKLRPHRNPATIVNIHHQLFFHGVSGT
jgi:hypothetical protein